MEKEIAYIWTAIICIAIVLVISCISIIANLSSNHVDYERSNCTKIIEWECECRIGGGFYLESNCEDYDNGNYKGSGGKNCYSKISGYKCEGEIYFDV